MKNLKYIVSAAVLTISPFVFVASAQAAGYPLYVAKSPTVSAQNILAGGSQVILGGFDFTAGSEPVTIGTWVIGVTTTNSIVNANKHEITNAMVYDETGRAVAGPVDVNNKMAIFNDAFTVPGGVHTYVVKGNIDANWQNMDTVQLSFYPGAHLLGVRGAASGSTIIPEPATVEIRGPQMTVKAGSLNVSPSAYYNSRSIIRGATSVGLAQFALDASQSATDVQVRTVQIRKTVTGTTGDTINSLVLGTETTTYTTGSNVVNPAGNTETLTFVLDAPLIVAKGTTQLLNLYGNISTTASAGGTYRFDFSSGSPDWDVVSREDGSPIYESISTARGATITVATTGGYSVTVDASAPTERWYAAGSRGVIANVLRFTATGEAMALTNLRLQMGPMGSSTAADVKTIELWDGATLVVRKESPAFTGGTEDFYFPTLGAGSFIIPKNQYKLMTIKVDLANIGFEQPGTAGQMVSINYSGIDSYNQRAVGLESSTSVTTQSVGTNNVGVVYFRSLPIMTFGVPDMLPISGRNVFYRIWVKADPAYDVAIHKLTFRIATTGVTSMSQIPGNFVLYDVSRGVGVNIATGSTASFYAQTSNYTMPDSKLVVRIVVDNPEYSSAKWIVIPRGESRMFELHGDAGVATSPSFISTEFLADAARPSDIVLTGVNKKLMTNTLAVDGPKKSAGIIWSDFSVDTVSIPTLQSSAWMNGYRLPGVPSSWSATIKDSSMPPTPTNKPDLTISSATFVPNPPKIDATTNVLRVVVANTGNANAGSFKVVFARNEAILKEVVVDALTVSATKELNFVLPQLNVGKNSFFVRVDYDNVVKESNEDNNATTVSTEQLKALPSIKVREMSTSPSKLKANRSTRLSATLEKVDRTNRTRIAYDAQITITEVSSGTVDFEAKGTGVVIGSRGALRFVEKWTPYVNGQYRYVLDIREQGTNATSTVTGVWQVPTPRGSSTSAGGVGGVLMATGGLMAAYALVGAKMKIKLRV